MIESQIPINWLTSTTAYDVYCNSSGQISFLGGSTKDNTYDICPIRSY